ncbi:2'-5' RNA ligase family protein [Candidatus Daviesbacteria bacterium]|nr:2'-5' RNA ligase family protein [Candidatus Daviesbacteria bacterium]
MKYTLWIVPNPQIKSILEKIILDLSQEYGGPYFEPHMTLLGDIEVSEKEILEGTQKLASSIKPFALTLGEISFSTTFFQNVFVRVKSNAKLMDANLKAKQVFKMDNNLFMPHISLLYGDHDMSTREKIASNIELSPDLSFRAEKISVVTSSSRNPRDWQHVVQFSFNARHS